MPITNGLHNVQRLRDAGFSQQQAETLAELLEQGQQDGFAKFSETLEFGLGAIRTEMDGLRTDMDGLRADMDGLRADVEGQINGLRTDVKREIDGLRLEMDNKLQGVRVEMHHGFRDQFAKLVSILLSAIALAVAVIKLFPDAY